MKKITLLLLALLPFIGFSQTNFAPNSNFTGATDWSDKAAGAGQGYVSSDTRTADGSGLWKVVSNGTFNSRVQSDNISGLAAGDYILTYYVRGNAGVKTKPVVRDNGTATNLDGGVYTIQVANTWEKVESIFTISGSGDITLRMGVNSNTTGDAIEVDDVSFVASNISTESNFLVNPDFETGDFTGWSDVGPDITGNVVTDATTNLTEVAELVYSQDQSDANNYIQSTINDFGNTLTSVSDVVVSFDAFSTNTAVNFQVVIRTYDASDNLVENLFSAKKTVSVASTWENLSFNKALTQPFNKIQIRLRLQTGGLLGDKVAIDNVAGQFDATTLSAKTLKTNEFNIYPNPAKDIVYVNGLNSLSSISIYDISGKRVMQSNKIIDNRVDVSNLNSGIFVVRLEDTNHNYSIRKLVVSK